MKQIKKISVLLFYLLFSTQELKSGQETSSLKDLSQIVIISKIENQTPYNLKIINNQNQYCAILGPEEFDKIDFYLKPDQINYVNEIPISENKTSFDHLSISAKEAPQFGMHIRFFNIKKKKQGVSEQYYFNAKIINKNNLPVATRTLCSNSNNDNENTLIDNNHAHKVNIKVEKKEQSLMLIIDCYCIN